MDNNGLFAAVVNMPVLSVALGLMFTYLIAALVASAVKEMVASVFQWRGTYLQQAIGVLLSNAPGTAFAWGSAWKWLVAHVSWKDMTAETARITAIAAATTDATNNAIALGKAALAAGATVAALPAEVTQAVNAATVAANAATAALNALQPSAISQDAGDIVRSAIAATSQAAAAVTRAAAGPIAEAEAAVAAATAALRVQRIQTHPLIKGTPSKLPSYVPARDFATAMLDLLRDGSASPVFSQVERTVAALPDGDIKRILTAFVQDAAGDLDKLRARIEAWFDDAMDRLSGIYKRFTQFFLLGLGIVIAVGLNIDSVHLAAALYQQPALRAQIVAQAEAAFPPAAQNNGGDAAGQGVLNPNPNLSTAFQQVQNLGLPIGRAPCASFFGQPDNKAPRQAAVLPTATAAGKPVACADKPEYPAYARWAGWTLAGWLITGLAISLGAPFWFGLLQNIMNLRAAGAPPPRADVAKVAPAGS